MRLVLLAATCALAFTASAASAETQTWFGFQFGVHGGSAPPIAWNMEPRVVFVDEVAVVQDDHCDEDVFRYSNTWWRMRGGWWYRSSSWRGPWHSVDVRIVPGPVLHVPGERWKHAPHGGPGYIHSAARHERVMERRVERREDRRMDRREDRRKDRREDRRQDHKEKSHRHGNDHGDD